MVDSPRTEASRFTFSARIEAFPVWSPYASRVGFTSHRTGAACRFVKPAKGGREEMPLVVATNTKTPLHWSPDGYLLLYANHSPKTLGYLWAVWMTGFFFFKQKTAYEIGLGIPAEPLFRSKRFCLFVCRALSSIMVICMLTAIRLLLTFVMSLYLLLRS